MKGLRKEKKPPVKASVFSNCAFLFLTLHGSDDRGHCAGLSNRSGTNSSPDLVVSRNEDWQRYKHKPQLIGIHEADSL